MTTKTVEVQIADQYQQVADAFSKMFDTLSPRTGIRNNLWRSKQFQGAGSCINYDRETAIRTFHGPAKDNLIELSDQRNAQVPGKNTQSSCEYHRSENGCVLNATRPPFCLETITYPHELQERFNIYGYRLSHWIRETLSQVMQGEADEKFVKEKIYQINHLIAYTDTFPVLGLEEQTTDPNPRFNASLNKA